MGLTDPVCGLNMGETAEVLAKEYGITREAQDAFALRSPPAGDRRARRACAEEIVPVPVPPDYEEMATQDNGVRREPDAGGAREAQALLRSEASAPSRPATPARSPTAARRRS